MKNFCIASGSKAPLITSLLKHFDDLLAEGSVHFLWPCHVILDQKVPTDGAAVVTPNSLQLFATTAEKPIVAYELNGRSENQKALRSLILSEIGYCCDELERVQLTSDKLRVHVVFPTSDIAQQFVNCVAAHSGLSPHSCNSNDATHVQDELDATDNDVLHVAQSKQFVQSAVVSWHDCAKKSEITAPAPLTTVIVSLPCQLHNNTHDVFVLTNCAIFIVKQRDFGIIRKTIPIYWLQGVSYSTKESGVCNVLLQPNFLLTKTLASDTLLTLDESGQEVLVAALARQYEAITTERLAVCRSDDVFWEKRGLVESQLIRIVNAVRRQSGAGNDKKNLSKENSIRSLAWLVEAKPVELVQVLCEQSLLDRSGDIESRRFLARCILQAAKQFGRVGGIVEACISWEIVRTQNIKTTTANVVGFFRSNNFATVLLSEFVGSSGDKCLRVLLSQVFEDFCSDENQNRFGESDIAKWTTRLVSAILRGSETAVSLVSNELQVVMSALWHAATDHAPDHVGIFAADYVFGHFLVPSFKKPHKHGIVSAAPSSMQLQNMSAISDVVAWIANGTFDQVDGQKHMFQDDSEADMSLRSSASVRSLGYQYHTLMVDFASNLAQSGRNSNSTMISTGGADVITLSEVKMTRHNLKLLEAIHKELELSTGTILAITCRVQRETDDHATVAAVISAKRESADTEQLQDANAKLTSRVRHLEASLDDLQRVCTTALSDVAQLQKLVQQRDNEIAQLRHLLQPSVVTRSAPPLPAREEAAQVSRSVFGCPLDGFALDLYSPVSGARR